MKLITKDFIVNEDEYISYQLLELVYGKYASKMPKESAYHLQEAMKYLIKDLEKGYPKLDITDNKLVERITFNEDTLKDLKKAQKK